MLIQVQGSVHVHVQVQAARDLMSERERDGGLALAGSGKAHLRQNTIPKRRRHRAAERPFRERL